MQYKEQYKRNTKIGLRGGKREIGRTDFAEDRFYGVDDQARDAQKYESLREADEEHYNDANAIIADELKQARAARRLSMQELDDGVELPMPLLDPYLKALGEANVNSVISKQTSSPTKADRKKSISSHDAKTTASHDSPSKDSGSAFEDKYIFSVGSGDKYREILLESRQLIELILSREEFNVKTSVKRIVEQFEFSAGTKSPVWQISQCKSIFMMRLIQIGLEKDRVADIAALCEALYIEGRLTKQQVRRGLVRLCSQFEELVELDNPKAVENLGTLLVALKDKNLISAKTLTVLPVDFLKDKLVPRSADFRAAFEKDLEAVVESREEFLERTNELLLAFFGNQNKEETQDLKNFFSQDVIINKWGVFNWLFIKRCMELVLQGGPEDRELLPVIFDEVAIVKAGFAAMDFGYAFDHMIWNVEELSEVFPSYESRIACMIADAIDAEIVPIRYLVDAEIYSNGESNSSEADQEKLLRSIVELVSSRRQPAKVVEFGNMGASDDEESEGFRHLPSMKKRTYSHRVSL